MSASKRLPQKRRILDPCPGCDRKMKHSAKGLCPTCYHRVYMRGKPRPKVPCQECGRLAVNHGRGLCGACYHRKHSKEYRRKYKKEYSKTYTPPKKVCGDCGKFRPSPARGLCGSCYTKVLREESPKKTCRNCSEVRTIQARGLCIPCYSSWRYYRRKGTANFTCPGCNKERLHYALGRCRRCWMRMGEGHQHHRTKKKLEARDGLTCQRCKQEFAYDALHIDHVWPRAHADTYPGSDLNDLSNLQLLCQPCNSRKHDSLPPQAQMALPVA